MLLIIRMRTLIHDSVVRIIPATANMSHTAVPFSAKFREPVNHGSVKLRVKLEEKILRKERFCSFEIFSGPDTTEETYRQLFSELEPCFPLFYSITWHASTFKVPLEFHPSLKCFEKYSNVTLLHLPAKGLSRENVIQVLNRVVGTGKANIFALQGDFDKFHQESNAIDFPHAIDLVKFIRAEYGSKFSIAVAGYPQMHPESPSKESDLFYLKAKVDAGANFIITQIIFESDVFVEFVRDCRRIGIEVPIIPGIFIISNYNSLINVSKNCKTRIPRKILQDLDTMKDDPAAIEEYGIKLSTAIVQEIFNSGTASGFHLFTLNRSKLASEFCKRLGLRKV